MLYLLPLDRQADGIGGDKSQACPMWHLTGRAIVRLVPLVDSNDLLACHLLRLTGSQSVIGRSATKGPVHQEWRL
jgi:hypothetical protein